MSAPTAPGMGASLPRSGSSHHFVALLSGKGGVGKTNLAANIAIAAAAQGARVLVVDGDLGLANLDVLLGLTPRRHVEDVMAGDCALEEALVRGPRGVRILPAASARSYLAALTRGDLERLLVPLREAASRFDLVLVDAGAGIGPSVMGLAAACARALLVMTPEPTSLADAYAALKVLKARVPLQPVDAIVNAAANELAARNAHERLARLARRFLGSSVGFRGSILRDPRLVEAVARQRAVVELFPAAPSSRRLAALAQELLRDCAVSPVRGVTPCTPN